MNWNRQPYMESGDTGGARNLEWYEREVLPFFDSEMGDRRGSVLDVGCGNGRFFPWLVERFDAVTGIDPMESVDARHMVTGRERFVSASLTEFKSEEQFDAVFFFGSMTIILMNGGVDVRRRCADLCGGRLEVFVLIEGRDVDMARDVFLDLSIVEKDTAKPGSVAMHVHGGGDD